MPIRFACIRCRQALQIASRKAGTQIKCPKCQAVLTVPSTGGEAEKAFTQVVRPISQPAPSAAKVPPETSAKALSPHPSRRPAERKPENPSFSSLQIEVAPEDIRPATLEPDFASVIVFDDVPAVLDAPAATAAPAVDVRREPMTPAVAFDPRLVAVSRMVLYAQAILIAVVAILSFSIGYFAGRSMPQPSLEEMMAHRQPVPIEGDVVYRADNGDTPDTGAVVIAVPHGRAPGQKFSIAGLKPSDPLGPEGAVNLAIQAIETEGGAYARADRNGQFRMTVRPGKYWVVAISAAAARPAGVLPTIHDVKTLGRYFENAADLLADRRYQLVEVRLPEDAPLEIALDAK